MRHDKITYFGILVTEQIHFVGIAKAAMITMFYDFLTASLMSSRLDFAVDNSAGRLEFAADNSLKRG